MLYFATWAFIKVASLSYSRAAQFRFLNIPEEKDGGVGKTLRLQRLSGSADAASCLIPGTVCICVKVKACRKSSQAKTAERDRLPLTVD